MQQQAMGPVSCVFRRPLCPWAWNRLCLCKCRSFRRQQVSNTISNKQQGQTCRVSIRVIGDGMVNVVFVYTCVWCGVVCLPGLYVYLRVCVCVCGCVSRGRNCARNVWLACFSCICTVCSLHSPPIACHKFAWYSFESDQASWGSSSSQRSGHLPIQLLVCGSSDFLQVQGYSNNVSCNLAGFSGQCFRKQPNNKTCPLPKAQAGQPRQLLIDAMLRF